MECSRKNTKSAFHLSGLTGPGELVLPGPNGKAVASQRDYARDMTCLRGQLRVFRKQTNMADVLSFLIVCEFFWCGEEEVAMENEIEEDVVFFSTIRLFVRREISRLSDRAPSLFLSHFPRGEIGLLFFLNRYKQFGVIWSAFHLSGLTGPGELVLPGPNGKAVASLRDYARDMTCLRGQLRVFRKQTNMADVLSFLIVCEFFWCGEEEVAMENEIEEDVVFFSTIRLFVRREISRLSDRAPSLFLSHFPRGEIGLLFFLNRYKQFGVIWCPCTQ